ncbi:hypothetical protein PVK06_040478 [Gossypium arboreum]|uniref:Uncharacterized protein n=1 Tax=Gossypium arboreum TaxID=29729 RepID=A0ABR0N5M0_GOSAR|nr:hypothetical protein PVK06_040478 [Gossypium arboreum]
MSTSNNKEGSGDCLADGHNIKKVWFKEKGVDSVDMVVDLVLAPTVTWKDFLLGNIARSPKETEEDYGEVFDFVERYFTMSIVNGIPTIDFSDQV